MRNNLACIFAQKILVNINFQIIFISNSIYWIHPIMKIDVCTNFWSECATNQFSNHITCFTQSDIFWQSFSSFFNVDWHIKELLFEKMEILGYLSCKISKAFQFGFQFYYYFLVIIFLDTYFDNNYMIYLCEVAGCPYLDKRLVFDIQRTPYTLFDFSKKKKRNKLSKEQLLTKEKKKK